MTRNLKPLVELTADGSHTLFVPSLNEHYHSVNGAMQESLHVFIAAGIGQCQKEEISVFEVGFGTGLNALLTAEYARRNYKKVKYTSIEAFPLPEDVVVQLNYGREGDRELYDALHQAEWGREVQITEFFALTKINADFIRFDFLPLSGSFDILYFDAFAPDVQPDMWSQEIFDTMHQICKSDAILTTYCAKGEVRRRMQAAGFTVERIPGPPGKREMLRARKLFDI